MRDRWGDGVWSALLEARERLAAILPGLFVLFTLLILGLVLGWIMRVVLERGARALGIGKEMVLVAFGITFGGLVFALALAFGLGGRAIAADLLRRRLRRESAPPQERLTHL